MRAQLLQRGRRAANAAKVDAVQREQPVHGSEATCGIIATPVAEQAPAEQFNGHLHSLPLVTLYLSERCNSRCVTCDYWRHGHTDMSLARVTQLLPSLRQLNTEVVLISGGEPLLNPEWPEIAQTLRAHGLKLWLLTSGLSLAKHARRVAELFDAVTVSLDGTNRHTYKAIRGLDAFEVVIAGIRAASAAGADVSTRVTLQRANYTELPDFVDVSRAAGARQVSFLAVDVANLHAFARVEQPELDASLRAEDLPVLAQLISDLERSHAADFQCGFIAESPPKLRRIHQYFAAIRGHANYPAVRCNAPEFSAVISATGRVSPCFFIPGPAEAVVHDNLDNVINSESLVTQRASIRSAARAECARCVCSVWRDSP